MFQIHNCLGIGLVAGAFASTSLLHDSAAKAATETVLYSFQNNGTDGTSPCGGLINIQGTLYGTTYWGGAYEFYGTLFSLSVATGTETVEHSFGENSADGKGPLTDLISVRGKLYGTTPEGGTQDYGTVFSFSPKTGAEKVVHSFNDNGTDGFGPYAGLINVHGKLYGTTYSGGANTYGTVFSLDPKTGAEKVVHSFNNNGTDGYFPYAGLINVHGTLYGTTFQGGAKGNGTVYSLDPETGAETVVHSFGDGTDGASPYAGLINVQGTLYGTTVGGGKYVGGTVFSLDPRTGTETVVYSFYDNTTDGASPYAGLINVHGTLYGTTYAGGAYDNGTVFSLDLRTGTEAVVHTFGNDEDGASPYAHLINIKGTLYGTTSGGGTYGEGTVFSITP
jgi:uncharacterized repeat protein (TIGR03803 family)